jgi:hypothetical protein
MKIKKANIKRLASLTALGAGAVGASAGTAEASSIVFSGLVDAKIGSGTGYQSKFSFAGPGGAAEVLRLRSTAYCVSGCFFSQNVGVYGRGKHGTDIQIHAGPKSFAVASPAGATFDRVAGAKLGTQGDVAFTFLSSAVRDQGHFTNFNTTDDYLLFRFAGGHLSRDVYGWAQLEVSFAPGGPFVGGPQVTLVDWAYDTSGAQIPAGDTGTPEPSTFVLTGLAALALGAKGLRAWRRYGARSKTVPHPMTLR